MTLTLTLTLIMTLIMTLTLTQAGQLGQRRRFVWDKRHGKYVQRQAGTVGGADGASGSKKRRVKTESGATVRQGTGRKGKGDYGDIYAEWRKKSKKAIGVLGEAEGGSALNAEQKAACLLHAGGAGRSTSGRADGPRAVGWVASDVFFLPSSCPFRAHIWRGFPPFRPPSPRIPLPYLLLSVVFYALWPRTLSQTASRPSASHGPPSRGGPLANRSSSVHDMK